MDIDDKYEPDGRYQHHLYYPMLTVNGIFYVADDFGDLHKKQWNEFRIARCVENGVVFWNVDKKIKEGK